MPVQELKVHLHWMKFFFLFMSTSIQVWVGGDIFSHKAGNPKTDRSGSKRLKPGQSVAEDDVVDHPPRKTRKVSVVEVVTKILYNPNRKDRHKASSSCITFASPSINENEEGEGLESGGQEADNSSQTGHSSRRTKVGRLVTRALNRRYSSYPGMPSSPLSPKCLPTTSGEWRGVCMWVCLPQGSLVSSWPGLLRRWRPAALQLRSPWIPAQYWYEY